MEGLETADEQRRVREIVRTDYFPAWCAAQTRTVDASSFDPDCSFLTKGMAQRFLAAIDNRVVEVRHGSPTLPDSKHTYLFERPRGQPKLYREGFLEVAAVGMLARLYGWRPRHLRFQSPRVEATSRNWAFDLLAYTDEGHTKVAIAGEAKWKQTDAIKLLKGLEACGARGGHPEDDCSQLKNHHRKYQGLLDHRPRILWIIGPDSFSESPDLVFRVELRNGGSIELVPADAAQLAATAFD